ncbi:MAG: ABC transporter ATP-binding protein, partial [Ruoffia tabacinasalis]
MKTFTRLLGYLRYEWKLLLSGFILLIFSTGLSIYTPIIASKMIDYVSLSVANEETVNITFITEQFGFYLIITFISAILGYVGYLLLANGSNRLSKVIRDEAHEHMQKLPVSYFDDIPAGKISARIVNDTEVLRENFFANFTTQILINTMTILGVYIGMFAVSPTIASWLLLLIPIIVVWQMAFSKKIQPINTLWRESVSELNSKIAEIVQGVSIVQVFNQQEHMAEEFEQVNQTWLNTRKESLKYEAFFAWNLSGLFKSIV